MIDFDCRLIKRGSLLDFDDGGSSYEIQKKSRMNLKDENSS
jgi:hypothetical protein